MIVWVITKFEIKNDSLSLVETYHPPNDVTDYNFDNSI